MSAAEGAEVRRAVKNLADGWLNRKLTEPDGNGPLELQLAQHLGNITASIKWLAKAVDMLLAEQEMVATDSANPTNEQLMAYTKKPGDWVGWAR